MWFIYSALDQNFVFAPPPFFCVLSVFNGFPLWRSVTIEIKAVRVVWFA